MFDFAKLRERRENGEKGFTLIELLVVVVIIGILIAIAIPLYLNYKKGAADKSAMSDLRNSIVQLEQCNTDNNCYPNVTNGTSGTTSLCGTTSPTLKLSDGTNLKYIFDGTATTTGTKYILMAWNTKGSSTAAGSPF